MTSNPYQAPVYVTEQFPADSSSEKERVSQTEFLRYRRASICLLATTVLFFFVMCTSMLRDSMRVDAAIASVMPVTMIMVICKIWMQKTADDAKLTRQQYRVVCSAMRVFCLRVGPLIFGVGLAQLIWVTPSWQIFPHPLVICGPICFFCGFLWPNLEV